MSSTRRWLTAAALTATASCAVLLPGSPAQAVPALDFDRQVLTGDVTDPTRVEVAPDGDVFIAERTGAVKVWRQSGELVTAGVLEVSAGGGTGTQGELAEGGLHGLLLDRDFASTRRVFLYRSLAGSRNPTTKEGTFRLSAFTVTPDDRLDMTSEVPVLDVPAEWDTCCHYGGDMAWDDEGKILLAVGDDTSPSADGFNPRDPRPGREAFNAERTSQDHQDLRGKVLRLNPDGSAPQDNPHVGDSRYHPLVYAMGMRSNYTLSFDAQTGLTMVGNVGPDANVADAARGPQGYDELSVIPRGGGTNHGWPRCIADNKPYQDYDYETGASSGPLDCEDALTGSAFTPDRIFYRNASADFPALLAGQGATLMVGPVYRSTGKGALALPESFDGKLIFHDMKRSISYTVELDADGTGVDPSTIQPFAVGAPRVTGISPPGAVTSALASGVSFATDFTTGPDGAVYVAEYGPAFYGNTDSKITRLTCSGCTPSSADYGGAPVAVPALAQAVPALQLDSAVLADHAVGGLAAAAVLVPLMLVGLLRWRQL